MRRVIFPVLFVFLAFPLRAEAACGADPVAAAQKALTEHSPASDHAALLCLAEAVATLQNRNPVERRADGFVIAVPMTTQRIPAAKAEK